MKIWFMRPICNGTAFTLETSPTVKISVGADAAVIDILQGPHVGRHWVPLSNVAATSEPIPPDLIVPPAKPAPKPVPGGNRK